MFLCGRFYLGKHSGRQLTLQSHHGNADLNAYFYSSKERPATASETAAAVESAPSTSQISGKSSAGSTTSSTSNSAMTTATNKHILNVSTHQMCVLMLFNIKQRWTYDELKSETDIPDRDLNKALQPLALGKITQRVLTREPKDAKNMKIEPDHSFIVNDNFHSKLHKIRITPGNPNHAESSACLIRTGL